MKAMLKGKFIALSAYIKKVEKFYTSNLTTYLKALKQKETDSFRMRRWQEIIKLRAESIKQKQRKQYKESMKQRAFFEKINKINKPLHKLIKRQKENIQINKIRSEKGDKTTDKEKIHRIIRSYYKNLYSTKTGK